MSNGGMKVNGRLRLETMSVQFEVLLYGEMGKDLCPQSIQSFLENIYDESRNFVPVFDDPR